MYPSQADLYFLVSFFTLVGQSTAQYPARVGAQTTRPGLLFPRQASSDASCAPGATSCGDGQPGCCNIGQACNFDGSHRPVCAGSCSGLVICSGDMAGLCCNPGLTCDTQVTLCVATESSTGMSIQTGNSTLVTTDIVTGSSLLPVSSTESADNPISQTMTSGAIADTSTLIITTVSPTASNTYYTSTFPSTTALEAGLYFTYTTVTVTDPSTDSVTSTSSPKPASETSLIAVSSSHAAGQSTKTVTTVVTSGQGKEGNVDFGWLGLCPLWQS